MVRVDGETVMNHKVTSMMVITSMIKSMGSEFSYGQLVIHTRESIKRMKEMVMVK